MRKIILFAGIAVVVIFGACKKETENFKIPAISDYAPLEVGKYIIYQLDSFVYLPFGTRDTTISYQAKFTVEDSLTDNLGKKIFRIGRSIRINANRPWIRDNSFKVSNTGNTYEFTDNNLLFVNLALPVKENYSWKGNNFLPTDPYPVFGFASAFMEDWDYTYIDVATPLSIGVLNFDNTITVQQRDDVLGDPKVTGTSFAEKTYSLEKYAKGVGLIYKNFLHWEFQGGNPGVTDNYKGFGIKLTIIEYN